MYGFPKRIKFTSVDASDARYFAGFLAQLSWVIRTGESSFTKTTYTIADSKKNRS